MFRHDISWSRARGLSCGSKGLPRAYFQQRWKGLEVSFDHGFFQLGLDSVDMRCLSVASVSECDRKFQGSCSEQRAEGFRRQPESQAEWWRPECAGMSYLGTGCSMCFGQLPGGVWAYFSQKKMGLKGQLWQRGFSADGSIMKGCKISGAVILINET
jgi:hypothetical protein